METLRLDTSKNESREPSDQTCVVQQIPRIRGRDTPAAFSPFHSVTPPRRFPPKNALAAHEGPGYHFITTTQELRVALERLSTYPVVGVALTTTGPDPFTDRLRTMQLVVDDTPVAIIEWDAISHGDIILVREFFRTPATKVFHNGKLHLRFLRQAGIAPTPPTSIPCLRPNC